MKATIEGVLGKWSQSANGTVVTGTVDENLFAYALGGSESDTEKELEVTINIVQADSVSIIAHYTEGEDYTPYFVQCLIDVVNNRLQIILVEGATEQIAASRNYALANDK